MRPELNDAEIEAIVAEAIAAEAACARREAAPPSSAIVWWRAQMRARQEAARAAERPIVFVHGLAIACFAGLGLSLLGTVLATVRGASGWLVDLYASLSARMPSLETLDLTSPWVTLSLMVMVATLVITSIAAFVIFADE
jgi:hypothetical protein